MPLQLYFLQFYHTRPGLSTENNTSFRVTHHGQTYNRGLPHFHSPCTGVTHHCKSYRLLQKFAPAVLQKSRKNGKIQYSEDMIFDTSEVAPLNRKTTVIPQDQVEAQLALCSQVQAYWHGQGRTPTAYVETYGCQQNEADSERIRGLLGSLRLWLRPGPGGGRGPGGDATPAPSGSTPSSGYSAIWAP